MDFLFIYIDDIDNLLDIAGDVIKEACKEKECFADRLKSYFESEGDDFEDWLMDYNYEPF